MSEGRVLSEEDLGELERLIGGEFFVKLPLKTSSPPFESISIA